MMARFLTLFIASLLLAQAAAIGAAETFTLQGVVTTVSGEPAANAEIYLYATRNTKRPADFISPKTGKNGAYRIELPKTSFWGVARVKKGERFGPLLPGDKHSGEPVRMDPEAEPPLVLDFTVADMQELAQRKEKGREELSEISGSVTSVGKSPANAYVYAKKDRTTATLPEYFSGWTDASGKYRIMLPAGNYLLGSARVFPPVVDSNQLTEISVTAEKLPIAIDLQLPLE